MSLTDSEAPGAQTSLPDFLEGGKNATPDDGSFLRHDMYFFKDGNVTFLIDGMLYCVHRYFFSRDSIYFSTRFAQLGIRDHEALPAIISIGDVERDDFEALLSVLYPADFDSQELTYEQWKSVLHLSARWDFASLRKLALKSIRPPTSHDQLVLARTYSVEQWVLPALTALCSRALPLSLDEARQMDIEDVILVAAVREDIRDGALRVDAADIPHCIEAAQAGKPNRLVGDRAKAKAKANATREAEAKPQADAEAKPQTETDTEPQAKPEAKPQTRAQAKKKRDAAAKAKAEAEVQAKAEADAWEKAKREAVAKAEAQARGTEDANSVKASWMTTAVAKAELEAKEKAEKKRLETEAKIEAEATWAKVDKEVRERVQAEKEQAGEQIAKQRAEDNTARAATQAAASHLVSQPSPVPPSLGWGLSAPGIIATEGANAAANDLVPCSVPLGWGGWGSRSQGSGGLGALSASGIIATEGANAAASDLAPSSVPLGWGGWGSRSQGSGGLGALSASGIISAEGASAAASDLAPSSVPLVDSRSSGGGWFTASAIVPTEGSI